MVKTMNLKITLRFTSLFILTILLLSAKQLSAQCNITTSGNLCVGDPVQFSCNSVGASGFQWDFNAEGTNNSLCNPTFTFSTPGTKTITLKLKLPNGTNCNTSKTIKINALPVVKFGRVSIKRQCFDNNQFCFFDSTFIPGDSVCIMDFVFDDGVKYTFTGNKVKQICHSFQDPAGGTYGVTVTVRGCNSCTKTVRFNAIAVVQPSLGLSFTSAQPKRCDSVILTVTNNSFVDLDSLQSFNWIWDDGTNTSGDKTTPGLWKTQVSHKYKTQGPNNGNFNVKLTAISKSGCRDTFTFNNAATNIIINPIIISSRDSVCAGDAKITFKLKDSAIIGAANPLFQYEYPYIPSNITRAWTGAHTFSAPGAYKVNFSFTHVLPGCGRTISDTIIVIGPQSMIESGGSNVISTAQRYQCVITDTVKFSNFSKMYHNDNNFRDDDSTFYTSSGFNAPLGHKFTATASLNSAVQKRDDTNIFRVWDFGDDYCERCTTDTKNNINVNKNCRYSKDQYPKHLYTDWDKVYRKYYSNTYRWINYYSKDSGAVIKRKLWADDTLAVLNTGDTIPKVLVSGGMTVVKWLKTPFAAKDSINATYHRRHFYESKDVKCFTVKLYQKDIKHPLACASENTITLAMMPPSAKNLRKAGVQCLGNDQDNYGLSFILDETKPGCHNTWTEINFDTAKDRNAWVPAIGKNLSSGSISMGNLPPVNPPFLISPFNNIPGNVFSKTYGIDDIKDKKNGFVDVGLIIGNGIHAGGNYPANCQDTVYYPKFARFPLLDNAFRVVSHRSFNNQGEFYKICKNQEISYAPSPDNFSTRADIGSIEYTIATDKTGKFYNDAYSIGVNETYKRFNKIHKDSSFLMDSLIVTRFQTWNNQKKTISVSRMAIARVNQWHTEADIADVYTHVKGLLSAQGLNITDFDATQLAAMIWNGKGSIGKAYTGSRGVIDTTGIGSKIRFSMIADQKTILHFRDTGIMPLESHLGYDNKTYRSYAFKPAYNGFYTMSMRVTSAQNNCYNGLTGSQKLIVGFYGQLNMVDTIICHGQEVNAQPQLRYFEAYPEILFRQTDPVDYWRNRIAEAGNVNREGYTRTDLSKDDDGTHPRSIFGGFPYSISGLDNKPGNYLQLGGGVSSLYYNQDTGRTYLLRMAISDSTGCLDTLSQTIYTTAARANFKLTASRPQCDMIIGFEDSSYVLDAHKKVLGTSSDKIIKWTIYWGDMSPNPTNVFFNQLPQSIAHTYVRSGTYTIKLRIETELGCVTWDSANVYIPGPKPSFDTSINKTYCPNDVVNFRNTSLYFSQDSCTWLWEFGDNKFGTQIQDINSSNNPIGHAYTAEGQYEIRLHLYYKLKTGNQTKSCKMTFPDDQFLEKPFYINVRNCDSTGIDDITNNSKIKMYPNPAHNTVSFMCDQSYEVMVYNVQGQLVERIQIENGTVADLRHLAKGLYILRTSNNDNIGKLIVD